MMVWLGLVCTAFDFTLLSLSKFSIQSIENSIFKGLDGLDSYYH